MRKVYEDTLKYQTKLWSRITIDKLIQCHVGTNHVQNFAFRRTKSKEVFINCIDENLKIIKKNKKEKKLNLANFPTTEETSFKFENCQRK